MHFFTNIVVYIDICEQEIVEKKERMRKTTTVTYAGRTIFDMGVPYEEDEEQPRNDNQPDKKQPTFADLLYIFTPCCLPRFFSSSSQ